MFSMYEVTFFVFAAVLITAAIMVILSLNPIHAVLFLILTFFSSAVLWMMMYAEFLSLVLIFVYVGAVMTLFLFVIMMLNIELSDLKKKFVRFLPFRLFTIALLVVITFITVDAQQSCFNIFATRLPRIAPDFGNVKSIGSLLYLHYFYPFEIAAVILLVAIIGAITLAFYGRKPNTKSQRIPEQLKVKKESRLRIIKMKAENS